MRECAATSSGSGSQRPVEARRSSSWRAVRSTSSASGRYTWPSVRATSRQDVLQRGVQAERRGRRDAQHHPQAVGGQKADAVDLVGQPIRVFAHQPRRIVAIRLAHAARVGFAETDVAQPRVDVGDRGHRRERVVDGARTVGRDALDGAQLLGLFANDLEHAIAEALDRLGRAHRAQVGGVRDQEGHDAAAVQVIDELERAGPAPASRTGRAASRSRRRAPPRAA